MQRGTHVSIDLERCSDCNSILYKELKKAYHGPISSQMLTMTLFSFCYWKSLDCNSPQSHSLFSASFQTFCLTARAYLNTQKYGLFCSLERARSLIITRRLKSFPWDALVFGSIMAFYLNLEKLGKPERCVMLWASMNRLPVWVGLMCLWLNL